MAKKNHKWFKKIRGSYIPIRWQGWLLYVPFIVFLVLVAVTAANTQDSVCGFLLMIFPQYVCAAVVMTWIANNRS